MNTTDSRQNTGSPEPRQPDLAEIVKRISSTVAIYPTPELDFDRFEEDRRRGS